MLIKVNNIHSQIVETEEDYPYHPIRMLREYLKVRVPNYQYTAAYKSGWDGYTYYCSPHGKFMTGLLPFVLEKAFPTKFEIRIQDLRDKLPEPYKVDDSIGLRDYQSEFVNTVLRNNIGKLSFPRGIIDAATNAGKNYMMAGLINTYKQPTLITLHNKDLFNQARAFFGKYFNVGYVGSGEVNFQDVTIAMYKSLYNRLNDSHVQYMLKQQKVLFIDEVHKAGSKEYHKLLLSIHSPIRVGFSGTSLENSSLVKNFKIIGTVGRILSRIPNLELIEKGVSQDIKIFIHKNGQELESKMTYTQELQEIVYRGLDKVTKIVQLCKRDLKTLIAVRSIEHGKFLSQYIPGSVFLDAGNEFREDITEDFKRGDIKVVITTLFREGLNIPNLKVLIMAQGGMSPIEVKQLAGRVLRKDEDDIPVEIHDFYDNGKHVSKHSRFRVRLYKKEGFETIKTY